MTASFAWTSRDVVDVAGPDAATYLQGQLSQDVLALAVGAAAPTFVLSPQGKVDGWGRVQRVADDAFRIDVDPGAGEAWTARLSRFLLRTKAEVHLTADVAMLAVRGAPAPLELAGESLAPLGPDVVGWDLLASSGAMPPAEPPPEAHELDADALEALRIRNGVPRWGAELDPDTIAATVGPWIIDASVSFTKGCYTGQELVARIDSRGGHVPRRLHGVVVDGAAPAAGAPVALPDGTEVGPVTSSASEGEGAVALVYVPRSVEVGDATPAVVDGTPAVLAPVPLPPA